MLPPLLREETIRIGFEAPNREAALAEMVALLPPCGLNARQKGDLLELLLERERFGTTGLGDGPALPHGIFPDLASPIAALGISRKGIAFPSLDGAPVFLLFLLVLPESQEAPEQKNLILHDAYVLFRDQFLRERLKIAETPEEVYEIILRESGSQLLVAGSRKK